MTDPLADACTDDLRLLAPDAGDDALGAAGADLAARWREPHRHYHDVRHLLEVLAALTALGGPSAHDMARARVGAWFHDAVHDGTPDDEERSAVLAIEWLDRLGASVTDIEAVAGLVTATTTHPRTGDPTTDALLDADLWILSAPPPRFDAYCTDVRAEYSHVPDDAYRAGRTDVLTRLLAGPVYRTPPAQGWEPAARRNVARELARLTPP